MSGLWTNRGVTSGVPLEGRVLGSGCSVFGGESKDAGFVRKEAARCVFAVVLGAGGDDVPCYWSARTWGTSRQSEDVPAFLAAGEYRID